MKVQCDRCGEIVDSVRVTTIQYPMISEVQNPENHYLCVQCMMWLMKEIQKGG